MTKPLSLVLALTLFLLAAAANGQTIDRSVISAGGESVTKDNLAFSYNIGEPVAELLVNQPAGLLLSVGFIQSDAVGGTFTSNDLSSQLIVFPNPSTTGLVKLDFTNIPDGSYQVDILDDIGHVLYTRTIVYAKNNNINVDLNVSNFKGGTYYIRVRNGSAHGQVKLIKI